MGSQKKCVCVHEILFFLHLITLCVRLSALLCFTSNQLLWGVHARPGVSVCLSLLICVCERTQDWVEKMCQIICSEKEYSILFY